ncbi:D-alanyl-D-alanine carboxypeptidase [Streptomyces phyllanthi]|uniref:D-alanyl-D-alanine carboxypeptidase n=1 Tax=Streptomyces phyllanthi TaxID=1803180 RepID=UPI003CD07F16
MAREKASVPGQSGTASSAPSASSSAETREDAPSTQGVDQATAVFSRRALEEATDSDGSSDSDEPEALDGSSSGDSDDVKDEKAAEVGVETEDEAETDSGPERAEGAEDGEEGGDGTARTTGTADTESGGDESEGDTEAESEVEEEPEEEPETHGPESHESESHESEADAESASVEDSDLGTSPEGDDSTDKSDTESDTESGSDGDARSDSSDDSGSGTDSGGRPGDSEPRVDQPTAIFKVRPPAVDQPTTMLKWGGTKSTDEPEDEPADKAPGKPSGKQSDEPADKVPGEPSDEPVDGAAGNATDKAAEKPAPEPEAERTSRFVALKPLDEPRQPKPAARPPAPPAPASSAPSAPPRIAPADATASLPQVGPERTAQQPLPPKPPIDLLAELTNTPPPPQTPVRTVIRRVKIWSPLVLLLLVVLAVAQIMRPLPEPTLDLTAQSSYSFDGGKVDIPWPSAGQAALDVQGIGSFGSSGEQKPVPIASVAKVMTAYVILRDHPLKSGAAGPKLKIDQVAEEQSDAGQESTVPVEAGDSISQREALESILIASANNVARLLARWDAGSEKSFVKKMNDAAEDLGMTNTTYTDPSGLNNTTVSTAVDQVKLAKEAMKQPAFREVAAMMSYDDYKGVNHSNWNQLVGRNNVVGIKTGTTTSALGNLVFAAKKDVGGETRTIVGAVVRQPAGGPDNTILGAALYEGDKLIRAAQNALESATILKKGDVVGYVDDGLGGRTPVVATQDVKAVGWTGLTVKLTFAPEDLPHLAKAGTKVGTLTVGDGGTSGAVKVPVALQKDLVEPDWMDKLTRLG